MQGQGSVKGNDGRAARRRLRKQQLLLVVVPILMLIMLIAFFIILFGSSAIPAWWWKQKDAYVFYATTSDYACGAFVAIASLQESGTPISDGGSSIDFVLLTFGEASQDLSVREQAKKMKVKIKDVQHLKAYGGSNPYYLNVMVKLRVFQLFEYRRIIFLEADMMIRQNLDHLFTLPESINIAAPQVMIGPGDHKGYFGSYLMVIKPSRDIWRRIMKYYDENENLKHDVYDMDLLNMEFMSDVFLLPGIYGMLTADWEYEDNVSFDDKSPEWYQQLLGTTTNDAMTSDEIFSVTKVLHFSPDKPMSERSIQDIKRNKPDAGNVYYVICGGIFHLYIYFRIIVLKERFFFLHLFLQIQGITQPLNGSLHWRPMFVL